MDGAVLWNNTGFAGIGLLKDGCRAKDSARAASSYLVQNSTISVFYSTAQEANGFFLVTSPEDAEGDAIQWMVHATTDQGITWKQVSLFILDNDKFF